MKNKIKKNESILFFENIKIKKQKQKKSVKKYINYFIFEIFNIICLTYIDMMVLVI